MAQIKVYTSDPGSDQRTGLGPVINVVEASAPLVSFGRGSRTALVFGSVVNDRGTTNTPVNVTVEELFSSWGGFQPWLGDGIATAGTTVAYNGNLAAQLIGASAQQLVLCVPNMEIRDSSDVAMPITVNRSAGTYGSYTLPAGTRLKPSAGTYTLATLEDVTWSGSATTAQTVRVRAVGTVSAVALNTVDTFVDTPADSNVAITTTDTTVPEAMDAAEVAVRYSAAFAQMVSTAPGMTASIVACDRSEQAIVDALSTQIATVRASGYLRQGIVSPPVGTTAATAQGSSGDGIGRATLGDYVAYVHPIPRKQFITDASNLTEPAYDTPMLPAPFLACLATQFHPAESIAQSAPAFWQAWKMVGVEALAIQPRIQPHWNAFISQPTSTVDERGVSWQLHDILNADGSDFTDRRYKDYLYLRAVRVVEPYHKKLATASRRSACVAAVQQLINDEITEERILDDPAPVVSGTWNPTTKEFTVSVNAVPAGTMKVITLRMDISATALGIEV